MQRSHSINAIGKALKRYPVTISREILHHTKGRQDCDQQAPQLAKARRLKESIKPDKNDIVRIAYRRSQYVLLQKVESRKANKVKECIIKYLKKIPLKYRQTITFDNKKEFSQHEVLSKALKIKCYFVIPYASWEKGLNEHANGLSRQYQPKDRKLIGIKDDEIVAIQKALNNRPKKLLNYRTPNEVMREIEKPLDIALLLLNKHFFKKLNYVTML